VVQRGCGLDAVAAARGAAPSVVTEGAASARCNSPARPQPLT